MYDDEFLQKKLDERIQQNSFRSLTLPANKVDFCSNDYLGIVTNKLIKSDRDLDHGSKGSRLLAGNYGLIEQAEELLANFHEAEAALIFNSGYDANLGLLSSVLKKGDTIIYDYLSHASIRDGLRLSFANAYSFEHNNMDELEKKLKLATGNVFVVTESVFSMDGDKPPIEEINKLCGKYKAHLIIDEAHATGVVGEKGQGLVQHLRLHDQCFARIHTFGKACGCHGAVVLGSKRLRDYLINFSRSFVYSTALPATAIDAIISSYELFPSMFSERKQLGGLINMFKEAELPYQKIISDTPIQAVVIPGNDHVKKVANKLQDNGLDVRPILYPTVPKGEERLRIVLHSFNSQTDLNKIFSILS